MPSLMDGEWPKRTPGLTFGAASTARSVTARGVQRPSIRRPEVRKTTQKIFAVQLIDVRTVSP
jgi:hypothetical protein